MAAGAIVGSLLVLVSAGMPADYSEDLFTDMLNAKRAGLSISADMRGMDSQSKVWLAKTIKAARDRQPAAMTPPDLDLNIDSTPFERLRVKRVPVFLYEFKGKVYRISGAYELSDVLASFARYTKQPQLGRLLPEDQKDAQ